MHMVGMHGGCRNHMGTDICLHGCMGLVSPGILNYMHGCIGLEQHMFTLVEIQGRHRFPLI